MKKHSLLLRLKQVADDAELKEIEQGTMIQVMILLLDYINDKDIETAVNGVIM